MRMDENHNHAAAGDRMRAMQSGDGRIGPKVLIVAKGLDVGGTEKHIVKIVPRLRERGVDVSVFVLARGGQLEAELAAAGVSIAGVEPTEAKRSHLGRALWSLYWHMRKMRPDVAHFFLPEPYLIGSIAGMLAGVRTRIMSRRSLAHYQARHPILARLEWHLHRHTGALIANSSAVLADLTRETEDEWRLGLIYNGVQEPPQSGLRDGQTPELHSASRRTACCWSSSPI